MITAPTHLEPRIYETLLWTLRGYSVEATARMMGVAAITVKSYRERLRTHFDAPNMTVVAALAVRDGYVTGHDLAMINTCEEPR